MGLLGTLGSLNVLLSADTAQFTSAMDKAAYSAEKNLNKIGIKAKLSIAAITAAIIANTKSALTFADSIGDMADRLGLTSEKMSVLAYAAKMSDVEVSNLEATIKKMYITAYQGNSAFTALGVKVKDATGKFRDGYDIFIDVAEAFRRMPDGIGKTNAAIEIFGKSGSEIIPLLNSGKDGIASFAKEAESLGVVINKVAAQDADSLDKGIKKSTSAFTGLGLATWNAGKGLADFVLKYVLFRDTAGQASAAAAKSAEEEERKNESIIEQAGAYEKAVLAAEKKKKLEEEGVKLTEQLRTAQEKYNDDLAKYQEMLVSGAINQETYNRAIKKAKDELDESAKKTSKLKDAAHDLGFTFQSAFEDAIINGEKLSNVLVGLLKDIERIILRTAITEPLGKFVSSAVSGMFNNNGSNMVTGGVGGVTTETTQFGTAWSPYASADGNVFSGGRLIPFANGGLIRRPTIFPMANGLGLAGEDGTEGIFPLFRDSKGDLGVKAAGSGGGGVEINIYAPEGSSVKQNSQKIGDKEQINIMIDEAMSSNVNNPSSKTHKALKNSFGLKQTLTAR